MRPSRIVLAAVFFGPLILVGPGSLSEAGQDGGAGQVKANRSRLHGYISFDADRPPAFSDFSAGMGFSSAVWPLVGEPISQEAKPPAGPRIGKIHDSCGVRARWVLSS